MTITVGGSIKISSNHRNISGISTLLLSKNKVFIAYAYDSYNTLYGMICTIGETGITINSNTLLDSGHSSGVPISCVLLRDNTIFIAHGTFGKTITSNASYTRVMVCTINEDNTITINHNVQMFSDTDPTNFISALKLSSDKLIITYARNSNNIYTLYSRVCTISENKIISISTQFKISSIGNSLVASTIALGEDKVLVIYGYIKTGASYPNMYAVVCTIEENNIIVNNPTELTNYYICVGKTISPVILSKDEVAIFYGHISNNQLSGMICKISDTSIQVLHDNMILSNNTGSGLSVSTVFLSNNRICVFHPLDSNKYFLAGMLIDYSNGILSVTSPTDDIYGVAKDSGEEGDMVDVYRPKEVAV